MLKQVSLSLIAAVGFAMPWSAFADAISVTPLSLQLGAKKRFGDLNVHNTGKGKAYVAITPQYIEHPGEKNEKVVKMDYNDPYKFGLLVSPSKLVVSEGHSQHVRVGALPNDSGVDRIYRIKVMPVHGEWVKVDSGKEDVSVSVDLIRGFEIYVVVRPLVPQPKISFKRDGKLLTMQNVGNTYVRLYQPEICEGDDCQPIKTDNSAIPMFVGNTKTLELPEAKPVTFKAKYPNNVTVTLTTD